MLLRPRRPYLSWDRHPGKRSRDSCRRLSTHRMVDTLSTHQETPSPNSCRRHADPIHAPTVGLACPHLGLPNSRRPARQGRHLLGRKPPLGFDLRQQATLEFLTSDMVKTSAIEGEVLDPARVRSSIARHLGMGGVAVPSGDEHIEGIMHVTLDSTQHFHKTLTGERLFGWPAALSPIGRSGAEAAPSPPAPGASIPFK